MLEGGATHGGTVLEYPCTLEVEDGSEAEAFLTCLKTKNNNTDVTGIEGEGRSLKAFSPQKHNLGHCKSPLEGSKQLPSPQSNAACSSS